MTSPMALEQKEKVENPVAIPTRPLWPLYSQILQVDTVTVVRSCWWRVPVHLARLGRVH